MQKYLQKVLFKECFSLEWVSLILSRKGVFLYLKIAPSGWMCASLCSCEFVQQHICHNTVHLSVWQPEHSSGVSVGVITHLCHGSVSHSRCSPTARESVRCQPDPRHPQSSSEKTVESVTQMSEPSANIFCLTWWKLSFMLFYSIGVKRKLTLKLYFSYKTNIFTQLPLSGGVRLRRRNEAQCDLILCFHPNDKQKLQITNYPFTVSMTTPISLS